jgi:2-dehydro-3-deoxygluconokinase
MMDEARGREFQGRKVTLYDVVTMGETMLRLTPPGAGRLDLARRLEVEVGGTESNTAVGLARLGLSCAWISRLPSTPLGNLVSGELARHGVDVSHVVRCPDERLGLYFYEDAPPARRHRVVYDRSDSAASHLQPHDINPDLLSPNRCRLVHLTGITPAISESARRTTRHILEAARMAGLPISFDTNYRAGLWSPDQARRELLHHMERASIVISSLRDLTTVFSTEPDRKKALGWLRQQLPNQICVVTLGSEGATACLPGGDTVYRRAIPTTEVGRLGGGDAFNAGFLYGWLQFPPGPEKLGRCLDWGVAAASLKYATPGDMAVLDKEEITALLDTGPTDGRVQR